MNLKKVEQFEMNLRSGFTLIELLCVIGIIGILLALFLPAVQSTRATARSLQCRNKMKQITIACANYESSNSHLPPGTLGFNRLFDFETHWFEPTSGFYWKRAQHTSSLGLILPFIELNEIKTRYEPIAFNVDRQLADYVNRFSGQPYHDWFGQVSGFGEVAQLRIPEFECPSVSEFDLESKIVVAATHPVLVENSGGEPDRFAFILLNEERPGVYGPTHYLGCSGVHSGGNLNDPIRGPFTGAMSSREKIRSERINDGTSHTFLYGESVGGFTNHQPWAFSSWLVAGLARGRSELPWGVAVKASNRDSRLLGSERYCIPHGFGSAHLDHVNFSFADGSTRSISRYVNLQTFYAFCGIRDGGLPVE